MNNTLIASKVCKSYGSKEVLNDLNLTVEPGCIYGLIGRNGAGKTTLLGILTGQNTMKVKDYFRAASIYYPHWDKEYAKRLTDEFGVEAKKKICKLSKGQMSMVTIIIALASRAPLTILDEPVAGLDVVARERFYQLLLEDYAETNRTFIFERVIILDEGAILEDCPTDELVSQFHYISGREDQVDQASAGLPVLESQTTGRHKTVTVRCGDDALSDLEGLDVDVAPLNLQKVFVALCGHKEGDCHE